MCCLFGMLDYSGHFTGRQRAKILSILATECEARGTDAAGIAYNSNGGLHVYKRPGPAHKLRLRIPNDAWSILGHTRMTTQGSEQRNYNNHPFLGHVGGLRFALAHNGVLHNDRLLQFSINLPQTKIETDSYIAVQLIEQKKSLDFPTLKYMAELVEGSFTFTILDEQGCWYLVKGDNPMCLLHFPRSGFYIYASTEDILRKALKRMNLGIEKPKRVDVNCGDILRIDPDGAICHSTFDTSAFRWGWSVISPYSRRRTYRSRNTFEREYLNDLKAVATAFGYSPEYIDDILASGGTPDEVEEMLYCGYL